MHGNPSDPRINIAFDRSVACFRSAATLFDPPIEPVEKLYDHLTCPKTFISFTADEAADAHVQVGAMRLACSRIGDWLDDTFTTARA